MGVSKTRLGVSNTCGNAAGAGTSHGGNPRGSRTGLGGHPIARSGVFNTRGNAATLARVCLTLVRVCLTLTRVFLILAWVCLTLAWVCLTPTATRQELARLAVEIREDLEQGLEVTPHPLLLLDHSQVCEP